MDDSATRWGDVASAATVEVFATLTGLKAEALRTPNSGALVLPSRALPDSGENTLVFAPGAKEASEVLRAGGIDTMLYHDGRERRELVLRSADVVLPMLLFADPLVTSLALSILANWIYDRWLRRNVLQPSSVKFEYAELGPDGSVSVRRIEGPTEDVCKVLSRMARQPSSEAPQGHRTVSSPRDNGKPQCALRGTQATISLESARALAAAAEEAISAGTLDVAMAVFRKSLEKAREATQWEPDAFAHRRYLHSLGRRIHDVFGCEIPCQDGRCRLTCPVLLSHMPFGLSIGGYKRAVCSLCGQDVLDCPHIRGHTYNRIVAARTHGVCNICGEKVCGHKSGDLYDGVEPFGIVVEMEVDHIAVVTKPADPLCVFTSVELPHDEVLTSFLAADPHEVRGGEASFECHHCLACDGS